MNDNKRTGALVTAIVVVLAAVATAVFVRVPKPTPGQALAVAQPTSSSTRRDPLEPPPTGRPQVPGWQVTPVVIGEEVTGKAYDVPPQGWRLESGGVLHFGRNHELSLFSPMLYQRGYCAKEPKSWKSMAGLIVMPNKGDIKVGVTAAAQTIADKVFAFNDNPPKVEMGEPQPVTVYRSKKAFVVTAKLTIPGAGPDTCTTPTGVVTVMMMEPNKPADDTSVGLVAMGDEQDATSEADLKLIVTSIHDIN